MIISAIDRKTRISGLTLTPSVSSSKNLSSPALAAGMGDFFSFFFLLLMSSPSCVCQLTSVISPLLMLCRFKEFLFLKGG